MEWCGRWNSLALHPSETSCARENRRPLKLLEQIPLLAATALDIELQAHMLARAARIHIFHEAMMSFENAIHFLADFFDGRAGHFVARHQEFDVERFFHVTNKK